MTSNGYVYRLNKRSIAEEMWRRGRDTAEIARALGVSEAFVVNQALHRPQPDPKAGDAKCNAT